MGPKDKQNLNPEVVLQAVIVADSFNENFRPLTFSLPRCLLPIANTPMIEYSLESLAVSGVQEIFIVCCSHSEKIKEYISNSRWAKSTMPVVKTIISQELRSMGDALRDLDAKQLIQSDFILTSGDVISNLNLSSIVDAHRERKTTDKNSIMTVVLKKAGLNHPTRSKAEETAFVLDPQTNECLAYHSFPRYPSKTTIDFDPVLFKNHSEILVCNDLIDCQIDICSVEVPPLFTENFDYQDIRKDFLTGILESDLLGKTVYVDIVENGYAAHVSTQQMYKAVTNDVMMRWTYPLSPDNFSHINVVGELRGLHSHSINNVYKGDGLFIDRSAKLIQSVIVGSGTIIKSGCQISNSVIGRNCAIGSNAIIKGSYILDNTVILDNCSFENSLVGNDVNILESVKMESGCIVQSNVTLGPNVTIPARTRISNRRIQDGMSVTDDETDCESLHDYDHELGEQATGYLFTQELSDDEDLGPRNYERGLLDYTSPEEYSEAEYASEESEHANMGGYDTEDENDWVREVEQTLQRAFEDNHSTDISVLELNTLKMAMNITFKDLRQVVIPNILSRIPQPNTTAVFNQIINKWCPILLKFTHSEDDQIDVLEIIVEHLLKASYLVPRFPLILKLLYDMDLLEESAIEEWFKELAEAAGPLKKIKEAAQPFITWLQEAETDSD